MQKREKNIYPAFLDISKAFMTVCGERDYGIR